MDTITISDLTVHLPNGLGPSAFNLTPAPPCPALISLDIHMQPSVVPSCTDNDAMSGLGVNYSSVCKAVYAVLSDRDKTFGCAEDLVRDVARVPLELGEEVVQSVLVKVELPRAILGGRSVVYSAQFSGVEEDGVEWECEMRGLGVRCVIGLHPHERGEKQRLEADARVTNYGSGRWSHRSLSNEVIEVGRHHLKECGQRS